MNGWMDGWLGGRAAPGGQMVFRYTFFLHFMHCSCFEMMF